VPRECHKKAVSQPEHTNMCSFSKEVKKDGFQGLCVPQWIAHGVVRWPPCMSGSACSHAVCFFKDNAKIKLEESISGPLGFEPCVPDPAHQWWPHMLHGASYDSRLTSRRPSISVGKDATLSPLLDRHVHFACNHNQQIHLLVHVSSARIFGLCFCFF
jgi:hypothetical protein